MTQTEKYDHLPENIRESSRKFMNNFSKKHPLLRAPDLKLEEVADGQRMTLVVDFAQPRQAKS